MKSFPLIIRISLIIELIEGDCSGFRRQGLCMGVNHYQKTLMVDLKS